MHGFRVAPMKRVRVGFIGVGARGTPAVKRIAQIPGCEVTAISDINPVRLDAVQKWMKENGYPAPKEWSRNGDKDAWKGLCDSDVCDVVYSATPRPLHCPINVYAMAHGKHVLQEVPGAFNLEECWATVEAAEKFRRHCMMLENCTYGEEEMLVFNLIKKGKLGEIVQAEVGYQHDQRSLQYNPRDGVFWRIDRHMKHHGNYYPTHGLVPAGRCLDINRGDRFEYLVSMETKSASFEAFGQANFPADDWRHNAKMVKGDINTCLHGARQDALAHPQRLHAASVRPRQPLHGHEGHLPQLSVAPHGLGGEGRRRRRAQVLRRGEGAEDQGGVPPSVLEGGRRDREEGRRTRRHGLRDGPPLGVLSAERPAARHGRVRPRVELSERSVNARSSAIDFPDYTRGGWKTAQPFTVDEIDMGKFDFSSKPVKGGNA